MNFWQRLGELNELLVTDANEKRGLFHEVLAQVRALDALLPPMALGGSDLYVKNGVVHTRDGKYLSVAVCSMGDAKLLHVRDVALPALVEALIAYFREARGA
jgi:hypothetical protein